MQKLKKQVSFLLAIMMITAGWFALPVYAASFGGYKAQLQGMEQEIYDSLSQNIAVANASFTCTFDTPQEFASEQAASTAAQNATFRAYDAFYREHPEVFWVPKSLSLTVAPTIQTDGTKIKLSALQITSSYTDAATISQKKTAMAAAADKIIASATGTDYDKLKTIHDAIVGGCQYSMEAKGSPGTFPYAYESYGALVGGSAVCEGYAKAFKLLCDKLGFSCVLVAGNVKGEAHMWNYVELGGTYYLVDATFDDPIGGSPTYDYFLKGSATTADHIPGGDFVKNFSSQFTEPVLSKTDFDPKNANTVSSSSNSPKKDAPKKENCAVRYSSGPFGTCTVTYAGVGAPLDNGQTVMNGVALTVSPQPELGYAVDTIEITMGGKTQEVQTSWHTFTVQDDCKIRVTFKKES